MTETVADPILFEHFTPGASLGTCTETYDATQVQRWRTLFGDTEADGAGGFAEQASIATIMMMRAYLHVVAPRPPGNIHAGQKLHMQSLPKPGETVTLAVRCLDKTLKRDRRFVVLGVIGEGADGRAVFSGELTLIWAA
ncbi:hypothetical protein GOQ25_05570 [Bordetella sp. 15P40C-2]|nr:hypothetical protein [Bordetella sp. 15P40C-2]